MCDATQSLFPDDLASKILWSPTSQVPYTARVFYPAHQPSIPIPDLPESINQELTARISYTLSPLPQREAISSHNAFLSGTDKSKPIYEPVVHLYCPYVRCNEVIDKAVEAVAIREGAEVLTLDALELCVGGFGDEFHNALNEAYKCPTTPPPPQPQPESSPIPIPIPHEDISIKLPGLSEKSKAHFDNFIKRKQEAEEEKRKGEVKKKDPRVQSVFDALISLPSPSPTRNLKRIVYIRDFSAIAKSAGPFIVYLLRAIHARRVSLSSSDSQIQPTILILGYTTLSSPLPPLPPLPSISIPLPLPETNQSYTSKLRNSLPRIGEELLTEPLSCISLSPMASQFFLGSLVANRDEGGYVYGLNESGGMGRGGELNRMIDSMSYESMYLRHRDAALPRQRKSALEGSLFSVESFDLYDSSLVLSVVYNRDTSDKSSISELERKMQDRRLSMMANAWFKVAFAQRGRKLKLEGEEDVVGYLEGSEEFQRLLVEMKKVKKVKKSKPKAHHGIFGFGLLPQAQPRKATKKAIVLDSYNGQDLLTCLAELTDSSVCAALDQAVSVVLGLGLHKEGDGGVVVLEDVKNAFTMLIRNHASRAEVGIKLAKQKYMSRWGYNGYPEDSAEDDEEEEEEEEEEDPVVRRVKEMSLSKHETVLLSCIVNPKELNTTFEDICIPAHIIETLRTIISLRLKFPSAFASGVLGRESMGGVLLYGPPGTGKSMVCRAVAKECGARMIVVKPSDVRDCWVGESEKIVRGIFDLAYRLAPCLIFIDEFESFLGKRREDDKQWTRDTLSEFLQLMDGLKSAKKNKDKGIVVIGATNRPQDIDEAAIRRLPSRMLVDAPDAAQRKRILELHLRGETLDNDVSLEEIAAKTEHYSGSDLKNVCVAAAMQSVKDAIGAFEWKPIKSSTIPSPSPKSNKSSSSSHVSDEDEEAKNRINKRTVTMKHLESALKEIPGSLSASGAGQSELRAWHEQFGACGPGMRGRSAVEISYYS